MQRVVITGAAGLVGQNLIPRLKNRCEIVAIDKHVRNLAILRDFHPDIEVVDEDMASGGVWESRVAEADAVIALHAQIGGTDPMMFKRNNITASERLVAAAQRGARPYLVHVSSSVVNSLARDLYTETKISQEQLTIAAGLEHVILRPTLMFGWFDRKHLGWLRRFMQRSPIFPVPGDGNYLRQPLYAGDFAAIIASCLDRRAQGYYNISGLERISYIDLIRRIRAIIGARTSIVRLPYGVFWMLLRVYSWLDHDPPFTTAQLEALVTPDVFEEIDWPSIFAVKPTPLDDALRETFLDPRYSAITLAF